LINETSLKWHRLNLLQNDAFPASKQVNIGDEGFPDKNEKCKPLWVISRGFGTHMIA